MQTSTSESNVIRSEVVFKIRHRDDIKRITQRRDLVSYNDLIKLTKERFNLNFEFVFTTYDPES